MKGALTKKRIRTNHVSTSRSGVALEDFVVCTWTEDPAFGNSDRRFVGVVQDIRSGNQGDFITVLNRDGVLLDVYTESANMTVRVK